MNIKKTWEKPLQCKSLYLRGSKSTLFEILQNKVPYEKFEKSKSNTNLNLLQWNSDTNIVLHHTTSFFSLRLFMKNSAVVEDCSHKPGFVSSNHTKTLSFHLDIWFFENFHRSPYFVGFQTKWIMTP